MVIRGEANHPFSSTLQLNSSSHIVSSFLHVLSFLADLLGLNTNIIFCYVTLYYVVLYHNYYTKHVKRVTKYDTQYGTGIFR